jgi:hypothetical protein
MACKWQSKNRLGAKNKNFGLLAYRQKNNSGKTEKLSL